MHITPNSYREVLALAIAERRRRRSQLITAALCFGLVAMLAAYEAAVRLPECAAEDSTWCTWDAASSGNGQGDSFITFWEGFTLRYSK